MKSKQRFPMYPFIFALYPVLFLYAKNMDLVGFTDCIKPLLIVCVVTLGLLLLAKALLKNNTKAGILVSLLLLVFFSYGNAADVAERLISPAVVDKLFFPITVLLLIAIIVMVVRTRRTLEGLVRFLGAAAVILLTMTVFQIAWHQLTSGELEDGPWGRYVSKFCAKDENTLNLTKGQARPDVYYIILDAYAREDALADMFQFDNSPFLDDLKDMGFYVASKTASNYLRTQLSVPSTLNMDFVDRLARESGIEVGKRASQRAMFRKPKVAELLRNAGYEFVSLPSGYAGFEPADPDITPSKGWFSATEFDNILCRSRILRALPWVHGKSWRNNILLNLEYLKNVPNNKKPTFTFAHIVITHPPFCFKADGTESLPTLTDTETAHLSKNDYTKRYTDSIKYANKKMTELIKHILAKSETPPIIILQGDHGAVCSFRTQRARVLNAYYLPDGGDKMLYPTISPVNSFRVVFNRYFGTHYKLLDDVTYGDKEVKGVFKLKKISPDAWIDKY